MQDVNPYAAPQHDLPLIALAGESGDGVWRDGDLLVMRKDAVLPDRCVKCNGPAAGSREKGVFVWSRVRLLGVSITLVEHHAIVEVGLCDRHRRRRRRGLAVSNSLIFLGILLAITAVVIEIGLRPDHFRLVGPGCANAGLAITFAGFAFLFRYFPLPVNAYKIDREYVWLSGVDSGYLAQFPPFRG